MDTQKLKEVAKEAKDKIDALDGAAGDGFHVGRATELHPALAWAVAFIAGALFGVIMMGAFAPKALCSVLGG